MYYGYGIDPTYILVLIGAVLSLIVFQGWKSYGHDRIGNCAENAEL